LPLGGFVRFKVNSDGGDSASYGIGSLREAPIYQRILVLLAGPLMNIVLAVVILAGLIFVNGKAVYDTGIVIGTVYPRSPAAQAGLLAGDVVLRINNSADITRDMDIGDIADANVGKAIPVDILRDGQAQTLQIVPGPWQTSDGTELIGFGISYTQRAHTEPVGIGEAMQYGASQTVFITVAMLEGLQTWLKGLLGLAPAVENAGVTGVIGMARGTGEIIDRDGWLGYLNWMALISINLAIFNLLPIPALDGSHILFALIEAVRRKRIPAEREAMVHMAGFMALMLLMVVVTISDIQGWLNGTSIFGQ
jgi:regulator of sigma E protease